MLTAPEGIPQSAFIFGVLFFAFLIFITMKGELPIYLSFLTGQITR